VENFAQIIIAIATGATIPILVKIGESYIARKQRLDDRRDDFTLQNLLDLQRAFVGLRDTVGKINRFQYSYSQKHGRQWNTVPLSPEATELLDNQTRAEFEVAIFSVRIKDNVLRDLVQNCLDALAKFYASPDSDETNKLSGEIYGHVNKANDRIGELIRRL
jgi:hypothetical protein